MALAMLTVSYLISTEGEADRAMSFADPILVLRKGWTALDTSAADAKRFIGSFDIILAMITASSIGTSGLSM